MAACEQSFRTTLDAFGQFPAADVDGVLVLDYGAAANLACFKWSGRRDSVPKKFAVPPALAYPARPPFKFGGGQRGEVRNAADILSGIAGGPREFTAFRMDADVLLFLRKGALAALGGQLDFPRNAATLGRVGIDAP